MAEQTYTPSQMAQAILNIPGGGNPTGTVIYYAGKTAPSGYLTCDGTVYNIADYPALAAFMAENYDANNYWGGDGETTFAVPDWQGEFFRASGTNSRDDQGSGAAVGAHQDATNHLYESIYVSDSNRNFQVGGDINNSASNIETKIPSPTGTVYFSGGSFASRTTDTRTYTARPTNTSLLVCIKT